MGLMSGVGTFVDRHVLEPFAQKPGLHLPPGTTSKLLTVEEKVNGKQVVDQFLLSKEAKARNIKTQAPLDMTPVVEGGFKEGDIVLRGNSLIATAQSGMMTSASEGLATRDWHVIKSPVSHSGIVARDASGNLRVIQMVSGETPEALAPRLTKLQKKVNATFLRNDSIEDFFNVKGTPITRATVVRPNDPEMAKRAAQKALEYYDTQVTPSGTHPWYSKLPHSLAPDGRGGVCSTFVDQAFGEAFSNPYHIPTTPLDFMRSKQAKVVGDRIVTDVRATGSAAEGVVTLKAR